MSIGSLLLIIAAILVFSGLLQRVLDRMYLTDRQALFLIALMLIGTILPEISLDGISINIGGAIIPVCICGYLLLRADTKRERWRSIVGTLITATVIYLISKVMPAEAEEMWMDPIWLYGPCGGLIAWMIGRSRRAAFICGVAGTLLADIVSSISAKLQGYSTELHLGGGGIADTCVISGVTAVLLCEIIGELIERMCRSKWGEQT